MYSRASILILDDIFSAVDAHVGRQLFEEALTGELGKGRTRILVTHHVGLTLPRTDYAVSLSDGTVEHAGYVQDLQRSGVLDQILKQESNDRDAEAERVEKELSKAEDEEILHKVLTTATESSALIDTGEVDSKGKTQPKKFTEDEKREKGSIKLGIWGEYLKTSGGWWFWPPVMLFFIFYQVVVLGRSWWISLWTRSYETKAVLIQQIPHQLYGFYPSDRPSTQAQAQANGELSYYLTVYVGISLLICITGTWRYFCVYMGSLKASRKVFEKLTYAVLRAPLRWLDTVPVGRVLNRFTADFAVVDSRMGNDVGFMLYQVIQLIGIIIAGLFVSPYMLLCAVGLLTICLFVALRFLVGAREVKRLESNAKSPIFEQFGSSLAGIGTIRAFDKVDAYIDRSVAVTVIFTLC